MNSINDLWQKVMDFCLEKTGKTVFDAWFSEIEIEDFSGSAATVMFPSEFTKNIVLHEY